MTETQLPDILARIVQRKEEELSAASVPVKVLEEQAQGFTRRSFRTALLAHRPAIIAEVKKASPSRGVLLAEFDAAEIAMQYERGGAAAISVLTDRDFFQGSLHDLQAVRAAVSLPVLRKDFTTSPYHVAEAAAHGADAILLIAAVLHETQLREFREYAALFGMDSLVEVHNEAELECAITSGAGIIGVNNRDLRTFQISLDTSHRLAEAIPAGVIRVAESGIFTRDHLRELSMFDAFLVGESLMRAPDPAAALAALCS